MSNDEYRQMLVRWAVEKLPRNLDMAKIVGVDVLWDQGSPGWSSWTPGDPPEFEITVNYLTSTGTEARWTTDNPIGISELLTDLFRLAELTATDFEAEQSRRKEEAERLAEKDRNRQAWIAWCGKYGPMAALFSQGKQVTPWHPRSKGRIEIPDDWTGVIDQYVWTIRNGSMGSVRINFVVTGPGTVYEGQGPA